MENSLLLPPVGVWAVLSPSLADHPLRPANDRRLGELLPHQQANHAQAVPKAHKALLLRAHAVLDTISGAYPSLWGTFLRVTQPSAARVPSTFVTTYHNVVVGDEKGAGPYRSTCMY